MCTKLQLICANCKFFSKKFSPARPKSGGAEMWTFGCGDYSSVGTARVQRERSTAIRAVVMFAP
jgi:hypothetical protein